MYLSRLSQLGTREYSVNSSRLKVRLLSHFPQLTATNKGRQVFLAFDNTISTMMHDAHKSVDHDEQSIETARVVKRIRKDIFAHDMLPLSVFSVARDTNSKSRTALQVVEKIEC